MKRSIVLALLLMIVPIGAQHLLAARPLSAEPDTDVSREVRHELIMLPTYTVFDNLEYQVNGNEVILEGQVTRPTLKSDAESVVKQVSGVSKVVNNIEVLPASPFDDETRVKVYHALFGLNSPLLRYGVGSVPPIHIVVQNGKVTLVGIVDNDADKENAGTIANQIPDIFSVTNDLKVKKP